MMLLSADTLMEVSRMRLEELRAEAERSRLAHAVEPEPPAPIEVRRCNGERHWSLR